jgi:hypothetical protein
MEWGMGRPPIGDRPMTAAERLARFRAKHKPAPKPSPRDAEIARLKGRIGQLEAQLVRKVAKPAAKPIDSDSELARLKTSNGNLRRELRAMKDWYQKQVREHERRTFMPKATYAALVKCLHPDSPLPTDKQRFEACGLLTEWKKRQDGRD